MLYLMILFLCIELKKILVSEFFFQFKKIFFLAVLQLQRNWMMVYWEHFFRTSSAGNQNSIQTTNKFDDRILVAHFSELQVLVLELQTNSMTVYRQQIYRISTPVFLGKQHLHVLLLKMMMRPNQYQISITIVYCQLQFRTKPVFTSNISGVFNNVSFI